MADVGKYSAFGFENFWEILCLKCLNVFLSVLTNMAHQLGFQSLILGNRDVWLKMSVMFPQCLRLKRRTLPIDLRPLAWAWRRTSRLPWANVIVHVKRVSAFNRALFIKVVDLFS